MESSTTRRRRRRRQLGLEGPANERLAQRIANAVALSLKQNAQGSGCTGLLGGQQARKLRLAEQNVADMAAFLRNREREAAIVMASQEHTVSYAEREDRNFCVICLNAGEDAEVEALPCGHVFHALCINQWLMYRRECPVDRRPVD